MYLKGIQLINFKNHIEKNIDFSCKINCFTGPNGIGKTNLLDAIYYLSMCKSYFNNSDQQNINHQSDFFAIHGTFETEKTEGDTKISCIQKKESRKIFKFNSKEYNRLSDHIGRFPSVIISPYDSDYINGGSELRRKYFDSVISQFDKQYLDVLMQYNKVLLHRNSLLKQFAEKSYYDKDSIEIWNDKLVFLGSKIHQARKSFLADFIPVFVHYYNTISNQSESVNIEYESMLHKNDFASLLSQNQKKDMLAQYTTTGIHKDDFLFLTNHYSVKKFCSQGQQKTFLVSLKLAQFEYIKKIKQCKPLLLLDDVFDKLDDNRVGCLTQMVANEQFGQVFITHTQKQKIEKLCNEFNIVHQLYELT